MIEEGRRIKQERVDRLDVNGRASRSAGFSGLPLGAAREIAEREAGTVCAALRTQVSAGERPGVRTQLSVFALAYGVRSCFLHDRPESLTSATEDNHARNKI
jgi:hypothetical protein